MELSRRARRHPKPGICVHLFDTTITNPLALHPGPFIFLFVSRSMGRPASPTQARASMTTPALRLRTRPCILHHPTCLCQQGGGLHINIFCGVTCVALLSPRQENAQPASQPTFDHATARARFTFKGT